MTSPWFSIPRCPTCGEAVGVYQNVAAIGKGQLHYTRMYQKEPRLTVKHTSLRPHSDDGIVRCLHCHKLRKDVRLVGRELRFTQDLKEEADGLRFSPS